MARALHEASRAARASSRHGGHVPRGRPREPGEALQPSLASHTGSRPPRPVSWGNPTRPALCQGGRWAPPLDGGGVVRMSTWTGLRRTREAHPAATGSWSLRPRVVAPLGWAGLILTLSGTKTLQQRWGVASKIRLRKDWLPSCGLPCCPPPLPPWGSQLPCREAAPWRGPGDTERRPPANSR